VTTCKPGWTFRLEDEDGALRLVISVLGKDARDAERLLKVRHFFPVPMATFNEATWRRWIFERCRALENHELGEWFKVGGVRPFPPLHGPGEDPYTHGPRRLDQPEMMHRNRSVQDEHQHG
jgi:hypothetical protein